MPLHRLTRHDGLVIALLFALTVVLFARYLLPTPTYLMPDSDLGSDLTREVYPLLHHVRASAQTYGQIPLWRDYALSGAPLFGSPINPMMMPLHWLAVILPIPVALTLDLIVHVFIAAAGTYLCLRMLSGVRRESALVGALIFAFAPRLMQHIAGGHWWLVSSLAWFPFVWLAFNAFWRARTSRWAMLFGFTLAMQALNDGKYLAISLVCLGACTPFYLTRDVRAWLVRSIQCWVIGLVVMFAISAPVILPVAATLPDTHRALMTADDALGTGFPLPLLIGAFLPSTLRFTETFLYVGVGAVILPLMLLAARINRRERWWLLGAFGALLLSLGTSGLIYPLLYRFVPGFNFLRAPERFFPVVVFALAMLSAFALDRWLRGDIKLRALRLIAFSISLVYLLIFAVSVVVPLPFFAFPHALIVPVIAAILLMHPSRAAALIVIGAVLFDLTYTATSLAVRQDESVFLAQDDPVIAFLRENTGTDERILNPYSLLTDAQVIAAGLNAADGYDVAQFVWYRAAINDAIGCDFDGYSVGAPSTRASAAAVAACPHVDLDINALRRLNVRYVILPEPHDQGDLVFSDAARYVYDMGAGYGRIWATVDWEVPSCAYEDHPNIDLVDGFPLGSPNVVAPARNATMPTVLEYGRTFNGEWFIIDAPDQVALIRSEVFAPGVTAFIGDVQVPVFRAFCTLQAIWLPGGGQHRVEFTYVPPLSR